MARQERARTPEPTPMFRLVDRYILKQLGAPFVLGMFGALIILSFGQFLRAVKYLTEGRVETLTIMKWFIFRVPEDMQYIFPAASLMATLFVFGRLSKENELAALLASGISLGRLMRPVLLFGVTVSLGVFLFNDHLVPKAMAISQRIWKERLRASGPPNAIFKENILVRSAQEQLIYVNRFYLKDDSFRNMLVRDYRSSRPVRILAADSGRWMGQGRWLLEKGVETRFSPSGKAEVRQFASQEFELPARPTDFKLEKLKADEMTLAQIVDKIRYLEERGLADTKKLRVEMYLKTAFPPAALIFAFIGAAIGISPSRSGGFIGFGVSLIMTFLYYVAMSLSTSLGKTGVLTPMVSAWLHNGLFLAICIYLFFKASTR